MSQVSPIIPVVAIGLSLFSLLIAVVAIILVIVFRGTSNFDELTANNINLKGELRAAPDTGKVFLSVPRDRITTDRVNVNSLFTDGRDAIRVHSTIAGPSVHNWNIDRDGNANFRTVHTRH